MSLGTNIHVFLYKRLSVTTFISTYCNSIFPFLSYFLNTGFLNFMSWPFFSFHFCMCFFDIIVYFHISIAIYVLMTLNFYIFLDNVLDFRPTYWTWWRPGILMHGSHHNLNMSKSELSNHPHFRPSPLLVTKWHHCVPPLTLPSSSPQQVISISFSPLVIFWMHLFTFTIDIVLIKILPSIATNLLSQILEFWCCTPNSIHHLHATRFFPENQSDLVTLPLKKNIHGD